MHTETRGDILSAVALRVAARVHAQQRRRRLLVLSLGGNAVTVRWADRQIEDRSLDSGGPTPVHWGMWAELSS